MGESGECMVNPFMAGTVAARLVMVTGHAANLQFSPRGELTIEATLNDAVGLLGLHAVANSHVSACCSGVAGLLSPLM